MLNTINIIRNVFWGFCDNKKSKMVGIMLVVLALPAVLFPVNTALAGTCEQVFGYQTTASSYCSFAVGRFNYISASDSLTTWVETDPLFMIGNGTDNINRKNAFTVLKNGNTGIGVNKPVNKLDVAGSITSTGSISAAGSLSANGPLGIILNAQDAPFITRAWDAFTSGAKLGVGRWGLFMDYQTLTIGTPAIGGNGKVQFARFNVDSSVASVSMFINDLGNIGIGKTTPAQKLDVAGNIKLSGSIVSDGDICIGKCI